MYNQWLPNMRFQPTAALASRRLKRVPLGAAQQIVEMRICKNNGSYQTRR